MIATFPFEFVSLDIAHLRYMMTIVHIDKNNADYVSFLPLLPVPNEISPSIFSLQTNGYRK